MTWQKMPCLDNNHNWLLRPALFMNFAAYCRLCQHVLITSVHMALATLGHKCILTLSLQVTSCHAEAQTYICHNDFTHVGTQSGLRQQECCAHLQISLQEERLVHPCSAVDCNFVSIAYATNSLHDHFVSRSSSPLVRYLIVMITCIMS